MAQSYMGSTLLHKLTRSLRWQADRLEGARALELYTCAWQSNLVHRDLHEELNSCSLQFRLSRYSTFAMKILENPYVGICVC